MHTTAAQIRQETKYTFNVEWYDEQAGVIRPYLLIFYIGDGTMELIDNKTHKQFLRRTKVGDFLLKDFYEGAQVVVLARKLKVIGYADEVTYRSLEQHKERVFVLVKPEVYDYVGRFIQLFSANGLNVAQLRSFRLSKSDINSALSHLNRHPKYSTLVEYLGNELIIGMDLVGTNALEILIDLAGDVDPVVAKKQQPRSLRASYGTDWVRNTLYFAEDHEQIEKDLNFFFARKHVSTAILTNCTLAVILPHAVREGLLGVLLTEIVEGGHFDLSALELFKMDYKAAYEFLEAYQLALPEFRAKVEELSSGPMLAMELRGVDVLTELRRFVGPFDPTIAKNLSPTSLRAKYGKNKVQNTIHVTDLPEDGVLECEFFFDVLQ